MTRDEEVALMIKGLVADLPEAQRVRVQECVMKIGDVVGEYGEDGVIAMAIVGSTLAAQE